MNIFERAARGKLRFVSSVGNLTVEQLFELPLSAGATRNGTPVSLDQVGREIVRGLKSIETESLVETKPNPEKADLELRLEIVKHVIASKQADAAAAATRAANAEERRVLLEAYADKKTDSIKALPMEEIEKRLAALNAA